MVKSPWHHLIATYARQWLVLMVIVGFSVGRPALAASANGDHHQRVEKLAAELRCVVCQNQSIADSQSELAHQLKREIEKQIESGSTDDQIRHFMVERYGEFILYRPAMTSKNALLWLGPLVLMLLGAGLLFRTWRNRQNQPDDEPDEINGYVTRGDSP